MMAIDAKMARRTYSTGAPGFACLNKTIRAAVIPAPGTNGVRNR